MRRTGTVLVVAIVALGTLTPLASAEGPRDASVSLLAEQTVDTIEPGSSATAAEVTVELSTQGPLAEDVQVRLESGDRALPGSWDVDVRPELVTFSADSAPVQTDTRYTYQETVDVVAEPRQDVPAFQAAQAQVAAEPENSELYDIETTPTRVTLTADYRPALTVETPDPDVEAVAGDEVHVTPTVRNLGNGLANVTYQALETPPRCAVDPARDALEIGHRASREIVFHLACDLEAEDGQLTVRFEHRYAVDPSIAPGEPVEQSWDVIVRDEASVQSAGVAGSSATWSAAAVALGAIGVAVRRWGA
jgi:hypothetical protein